MITSWNIVNSEETRHFEISVFWTKFGTTINDDWVVELVKYAECNERHLFLIICNF